MPLTAIFFDIGGTLLFPDQERILEPLLGRGLSPSATQLAAAERAAKIALDRAPAPEAASRLSASARGSGAQGAHKDAPWPAVDRAYWDIYYTRLLEEIGPADPAVMGLKPELVRRTQTSSNWSRLAPGTHEVLLRLKQSYRLGVISNSDGGIAALLQRLGIARLFDSVTDSGVVGYQKPDPRIFRAALESLEVEAAESLYLGDIYSVDYVGATGVGMKALLMDAGGVYREAGWPRIESLEELFSVTGSQKSGVSSHPAFGSERSFT